MFLTESAAPFIREGRMIMNDKILSAKKKEAQRLGIFLILAFSLAWVYFILTIPKGSTWDQMTPQFQSLASLGMLTPVIAHVLTRLFTKEGFALTGEDSMMLGIRFQKSGWAWYLLAMLLPWFYQELANGIALLICPELYDPEYYKVLGIDQKMLLLLPVSSIVSGTILSFAAFGEEGGWRGYMMPKLMKLMGRKEAFFTGGIIWGLWHAPLTCIGHNFGTDYPGFPYLGIFKMCTLCIFLGMLLTYMTEKSGSVWPAAILHAVNNTSPGILNGYINYEKVSGLRGNVAGFIGIIVSLLLVLTIFWRLERRRRRVGIHS